MSEWELRVSQKEIHRLHVVRLTIEGRKQFGRGAKLLGISPQQMKRLRRKMKEGGLRDCCMATEEKRRPVPDMIFSLRLCLSREQEMLFHFL